MSDPVFDAMYISFRHMKTTGNYKIELEIPPDRFQKMLDTLGTPPGPGESVWVGVARLKQPEAV